MLHFNKCQKKKKSKVKLIYDVESQNSDYHCGVMVLLIGEGQWERVFLEC